MDFKQKPAQHYQNGNSYMEKQQQPQHHYRSPNNEMSTNQSVLHHINSNKHQEQNFMDMPEYQSSQQKTMFVKNHYHSPKSRHVRRRARSECLSPSASPQHYHNQNYQQYQSKTYGSSAYACKDRQQHEIDQWRLHRREEEVNKYRDYQQQLKAADTYKHRFHNLQIDGKELQFEEMYAARNEIDNYTWHQRRLRASSESASQDYYFRESFPEIEDYRSKRTRESTVSPAKERIHRPAVPSHHVTNPKNNFSVLVNNTTHYRYSPKSKVRSHYLGHKVGLVRVSSPLHKARMQMWKNQSSSPPSPSIPSTGSNSTPETPQIQGFDDDDDSDDYEDDDPLLWPEPPADAADDLTDPEDNYESSLSVSSSERSLAAPTPTINTDCVQGGKVPSAPFAPSLFPFVPPFITFASYEEKGPEIPAIIHKQLKWKLTTITPLLVRKVILNTGFRLMKSEFRKFYTPLST